VVCIWGAGPVGILAAHCALHRNAKSVTLIDQVRLMIIRLYTYRLYVPYEGSGSKEKILRAGP
jgi:predicted NAD/FAD-dependent oxidoreductase